MAQFRGDGVLVYFSYPQAHEDDAERAVKAGLEIIAALGETTAGGGDAERLRVRIGIHTGPVVVGQTGVPDRREPLAHGHTLNVAARLQTIAAPDTVVLSADTLRLVQGVFVTEPLGDLRLKGIAQPVGAHRALRPSGVRSRLDVAAAKGLTPLVGRDRDIAVLLERWKRLGEGIGSVTLVRGDAGIGKSRLVRTLGERLVDEQHTWLECRGSPHHLHSAFHPVIDLLRQGLRFSGAGTDQQAAWVERAVDLAGIEPRTAVPLLAGLLSLPLPDRYAPLALAPDDQRRQTLEVLVAWLCALAALQPLVLVLEDLHWMDPSSLELLGTLVDRLPTVPILVVGTFRPTFDAAWLRGTHIATLTVEPLTRGETVAMIHAIAGEAPLGAGVLEHIVHKTDGVPLYIEELTQTLLESGSSGDQTVPATLQDSLAARLDRLGPAREVAQLAAVLGREFSRELITAAWTAEPDALEGGLERLEVAGLVFRRGEPPATCYTFKHALIQDAAYESLLKETRHAWHAHIAKLLPERFPSLAANEPEQVARHCEAGGLADRAIEYYRRAAAMTSERSAHAEAIGHLRRAIALLETLPASPQRHERELGLQVALGASLSASKGWGADESRDTYDRARALCNDLGDRPERFPVIRGLVAFAMTRGQIDEALDLAAELLRLAERSGDGLQGLWANHHLGVAWWYRGDQHRSLRHFERALSFYDPEGHRTQSAVYQTDPGVDVRLSMTMPLWALGFPTQAVARSDEAIERARSAAQHFGLGYALLWRSTLHFFRREPALARQAADEAIAVGREYGFSFVLNGGIISRAIADLSPGATDTDVADAMRAIYQALGEFGAMGVGGGRPHTLGELARGLAAVGRVAEARTFLDAATQAAADTTEAYWDAELHRLRGQLLAADAATRDEAMTELRRALDVASAQRARMLELRAAVSLIRFLDRGSERARILEGLAHTHATFTEGFDLPDLVEARALLNDRG